MSIRPHREPACNRHSRPPLLFGSVRQFQRPFRHPLPPYCQTIASGKLRPTACIDASLIASVTSFGNAEQIREYVPLERLGEGWKVFDMIVVNRSGPALRGPAGVFVPSDEKPPASDPPALLPPCRSAARAPGGRTEAPQAPRTTIWVFPRPRRG